MTSTEPLIDIDDAQLIGADPWLETRLDHPEDIAVADDNLLYAGGEDGQIYRVDLNDCSVTEIANTGGFVLGLTIGPDEDLYACDFQRHAVIRLPLTEWERDGAPETVVSGGPDNPPWHPNYCVFDQEERLYISDSGDRSDMANAGGCIYAVDPAGEGYVVTDETSAFPNGVTLSADGETLYVAETGTHTVSTIHLHDGQATTVDPLDVEFGLVDGLALDANDTLYAVSIGDNAVYRLREDTVETVVRDPDGLVIGNPTNVAFGGADMRTLYIANLGLWHVTAVEVDQPGRYPTGR